MLTKEYIGIEFIVIYSQMSSTKLLQRGENEGRVARGKRYKMEM